MLNNKAYLKVFDMVPFINYIGILYRSSPIFHIFSINNMESVLIEIDLNNPKFYFYSHGFEEEGFYNTNDHSEFPENEEAENEEDLYIEKRVQSRTNIIAAFCYDQFNSLLYFVTEEMNLFVVTIKINNSSKNYENSYYYDSYGNFYSSKNNSSNTPNSYEVVMIINLKPYLSNTENNEGFGETAANKFSGKNNTENENSKLKRNIHKSSSSERSFIPCTKNFNSNINNKSASDCFFMNMEVIRKDLFIKVDSDLIIVNLETFNSSNSDPFDALPQIQKKSLLIGNTIKPTSRIHINHKMAPFYYMRNSHGYYFIVKADIIETKIPKDSSSTSDNREDTYQALMFFQILLPNNSFIGTEEFSFNFKIPVIFIALIILVVYHFIAKSKEKSKMSDDQTKAVREELMDHLKSQGVDLKKKKFQGGTGESNASGQKAWNDLRTAPPRKEIEDMEADEDDGLDPDEINRYIEENLKKRGLKPFNAGGNDKSNSRFANPKQEMDDQLDKRIQQYASIGNSNRRSNKEAFDERDEYDYDNDIIEEEDPNEENEEDEIEEDYNEEEEEYDER